MIQKIKSWVIIASRRVKSCHHVKATPDNTQRLPARHVLTVFEANADLPSFCTWWWKKECLILFQEDGGSPRSNFFFGVLGTRPLTRSVKLFVVSESAMALVLWVHSPRFCYTVQLEFKVADVCYGRFEACGKVVFLSLHISHVRRASAGAAPGFDIFLRLSCWFFSRPAASGFWLLESSIEIKERLIALGTMHVTYGLSEIQGDCRSIECCMYCKYCKWSSYVLPWHSGNRSWHHVVMDQNDCGATGFELLQKNCLTSNRFYKHPDVGFKNQTSTSTRSSFLDIFLSWRGLCENFTVFVGGHTIAAWGRMHDRVTTGLCTARWLRSCNQRIMHSVVQICAS